MHDKSFFDLVYGITYRCFIEKDLSFYLFLIASRLVVGSILVILTIWFLTRKQKHLRKYLLTFLLIVIVFIGFFPEIYLGIDKAMKFRDAKTKVDNYIQGKVGKELFSKWFVFDSKSTEAINKRHGIRNYSILESNISYRFLPMVDYGQNYDVNVTDDGQIREVSGLRLPYCVKDSTYCVFNVSKKQAIEIAKNNGLSAQDLKVDLNATLWYGESINGLPMIIRARSCLSEKTIEIDYRDGNIIKVEKGC